MSRILVTKGGCQLFSFETDNKYFEAYKEAGYAVNIHAGTKIEDMPATIVRAKREIDNLKHDCNVKGKVYAALITSVDNSFSRMVKAKSEEEYLKLWPNLYVCFLMDE